MKLNKLKIGIVQYAFRKINKNRIDKYKIILRSYYIVNKNNTVYLFLFILNL